jgi:hypothetical protein
MREPAVPPVNKEKFHIYLLIGQSNMAGRGVVEPQDTIAQHRIYRMNRAGDWDRAKDPLHFDKPGAGVGPGLTFAREMLKEADKDVYIGLVPCAVGGTGIDAWQTGVFFEQTKSYPYDDMLLRIKLALKDGALKGILWHQGENDADDPALHRAYKDKFIRFVNRLRRDLHSPYVPFLSGELAPFAMHEPGVVAITQTFHDFEDEWLHYGVVSSSDLQPMPDGVHFDAPSARELGRRYAEKMKVLQQDKSNLMYYHDDAGRYRRVQTTADWQRKCTEIRDSMEAIMGPFPSLEHLPPLDVQYTDTLVTPAYTRYTIRFTAAENEMVPAYLYIPFDAAPGKKYPAMLVLQPTSDLGKDVVDGGGKPDRAYGKELAQRGYVVLAPDYPSFGDLKDYDFKNDRYLSGTMAGIFYHVRSVDLLTQLPCVDTVRIGVIGLSLGGHNAMWAASFDLRLKLIVSSCGWTEHDYFDIGPAPEEEAFRGGGRLWADAHERYYPLLRDKYHFDDYAVPYQWHEVIGLLAPRPFFSHSPVNDSNFDVEGVRIGIERGLEAYRFFRAENNLRVLYSDGGHNLGESRREVYHWIDSVFRHKPPTIKY